MKVLFNKLKKANKIFLIIYLLTTILFLGSYIFLFKNLLSLNSIETAIRIIILLVLLIWWFIYLIWNLTNLILKRHITIAITTAFTVILMVGCGLVNYYIEMLNHHLDNIAEKKYVTYTMNLMALKGTSINNESKIGIINNPDEVDKVLIKEFIANKNIQGETKEFSSYYEMIYALLNKEIEGILINSNYLTIFSEDEFEGIENVITLDSYSKEMENQDKQIISNKSLKEPFTILLMGVDSEADGLNKSTSFNGDTLMMITFNPKTLNATMFSIPRDTYVPIACNNNRYAKINSSAAYGTNCVINTVQALTDINIDYYVKINFKGVVDLVEALGGVDVEVEAPDYNAYIKAYNGRVCEQNSLRQKGDHLICIDPGMQHLNGEEALAYARCRHAYLLSDIARNKHQQQIIEALAKKAATPSNITKLDQILSAITNNLDTNMARDQILSFYDVLKDMITKTFKDGEFITIEKTYLEYYSLPVRLSNNGTITSAIGHYPGSLEAIVNLMKANLELEEKEMIKTFSFDANENYERNVVGQGIRTGDILEVVPNFVGLSVSQAQNWADAKGITLNVQFVDNLSPFYNPNILQGMISNQSVNNGVLINNVSELTVYVNNNSTPQVPQENPEEEPEENQNENNSEENPEIDLPEVIFPSESENENEETSPED